MVTISPKKQFSHNFISPSIFIVDPRQEKHAAIKKKLGRR